MRADRSEYTHFLLLQLRLLLHQLAQSHRAHLQRRGRPDLTGRAQRPRVAGCVLGVFTLQQGIKVVRHMV
eukprot:COSAG01_NODE_17863_length_1118_cov_1.910697_1_plen_70_part_00